MMDPTRIEIATDPTTRRMKGIARHGDTPFDVPYITEVMPGLWQGGCEDGMVLPEYIRHLVSLYPWEQYTVKHELSSSLTVRMFDSLDQNPRIARDIATWAYRRWDGSYPVGDVLIHCQAGLNRSALVTALILMQDGWKAEDAIKQIRERRSPAVLCNPAFEEWLLKEDVWDNH